jgi:hypothetical protein
MPHIRGFRPISVGGAFGLTARSMSLSKCWDVTVGPMLTLVLAAVAGWGLWQACRPRSAFVIRIKAGVPRAVQGKVTREFLNEVGRACGRHQVRQGVVRGLVKDQRIALSFSGGIPEPCRQQLRNLWGVSGWSAGPRPKRA